MLISSSPNSINLMLIKVLLKTGFGCAKFAVMLSLLNMLGNLKKNNLFFIIFLLLTFCAAPV
jgi:hypothetical protein